MNEKQKIERVLGVFQEYLQEKAVVEVLWSQKQQRYICIWWREYGDAELQVIDSAEDMCELLLAEIDTDVYLDLKLQHRIGSDGRTEECRVEAERRMQKYLDQLPEYQYLMNQIFTND